MNDIATASDRGRRTVYTYFRTKDEVYQAVIEDEANRIVSELESTVLPHSTPADRLRALMEFRIALAKESSKGGHEVWFKSLFSRDIKRANSVRALVTDRIYRLIDEIVSEGVAAGDFIPTQAARVSSMLSVLVRGNDWTHMRGTDPEQRKRWIDESIDFVIDAIKYPQINKPTN